MLFVSVFRCSPHVLRLEFETQQLASIDERLQKIQESLTVEAQSIEERQNEKDGIARNERASKDELEHAVAALEQLKQEVTVHHELIRRLDREVAEHSEHADTTGKEMAVKVGDAI